MTNILVSTLGLSWGILPELLAFTNPGQFPLYQNHHHAAEIEHWRREYSLHPVQQVWIVTTGGNDVQDGLQTLQDWKREVMPALEMKIYSSAGLNNLSSAEQCLQMRDLIFRTVFQAHARAGSGQVILSLAGGRKTMSADMQEAGSIFGCQALLHVVDNGNLPSELKKPRPEYLSGPLPADIVNALSPIVIAGRREPSPAVFAEPPLKPENFPLPRALPGPPCTDLAEEITRRNLSAGALLCNFISRINHSEGSNFYSLYGLPPQRLNALRQHRLGQFPEQQQTDLEWLQRIPKAELHCHLGGILTPREIIEVAEYSQAELADLCRQNPELAAWQEQISAAVSARDTQSLRFWFKHKDALRRAVKDVPEPFCLIAFVLAFQTNPDLLARLIYHHYPKEDSFQDIGIENYEMLGDLQGSGLLQNEKSLRAACQILIQHCLRENITYLELRCSPVNYTRGGLSGEKVTEILLQELQPCRSTYFTLLFIASRHGRMSDVYRQIELTAAMLDHPTLGENFRRRFVGFDLAGAEHSRSPRELREAFSSLHKRCLNITIHAGETAPADSVWEAVYFLNADRIGHGLTLKDNPNLINLVLNRRIAIEMCPSSNFQICSFRDAFIPQSDSNKTYPLQEYLQQGLRVSICTDNPGISSTTLSQEYLKAARLCPGGLSQWDTLRLCRNAFQASFAPFTIRREILRKAEKHISEILEKNDY